MRNTRKPSLVLIVLCLLSFGACGPPRTAVVENASLEKAIASYIDGDLQHAEALFNGIIEQGRADDDYRTACLYLGRIYLAEQDYEKAADVLSAGKALGGDVRFDEYFEIAQRHLMASPARIAQLDTITREQLAALVDEMFGSSLDRSSAGAGAGAPNPVLEGEGAKAGRERDSVGVVTRSGVMTRLPDGEFHPEEKVTRSAFYGIAARLAGLLDAPPGVMEEMFPGGYRETLAPQAAGAGNDGGTRFLSGREAAETLQMLARRIDS